jgi:hypothetical protein
MTGSTSHRLPRHSGSVCIRFDKTSYRRKQNSFSSLNWTKTVVSSFQWLDRLVLLNYPTAAAASVAGGRRTEPVRWKESTLKSNATVGALVSFATPGPWPTAYGNRDAGANPRGLLDQFPARRRGTSVRPGIHVIRRGIAATLHPPPMPFLLQAELGASS